MIGRRLRPRRRVLTFGGTALVCLLAWAAIFMTIRTFVDLLHG